MDEHKKFLADRLLSEERPITYRLLSRSLGIHVDTAKQMLYDFHQYQNEERANSVHATYLVYGSMGAKHDEIDGDVDMSSSIPELESASEIVPVTTLTLVREENLHDILANYQEVISIHVYSLAPHPQRDLALLSHVSKSDGANYADKEEIFATAKKYGTIINPSLRMRNRRSRSKAAPSSAAQPTAKSASAPSKAAHEGKAMKQEDTEINLKDKANMTTATEKKTPSLTRVGSGGIMQSFAKASARPAKPKPAPKQAEEQAVGLSDDGEADDSDFSLATKKGLQESGTTRKSRKQREDELRRMMEEDEGEDAVAVADMNDEEPTDEEMEEAPEPEEEPIAEEESKTDQNEEQGPPEVVSSSGDGRRRGTRRVMTKKRILDAQGYMVTIQEPGWESFSEEDMPPPSKKAATSTAAPSTSSTKAKKPAGKIGQGNIMSFFSKK